MPRNRLGRLSQSLDETINSDLSGMNARDPANERTHDWSVQSKVAVESFEEAYSSDDVEIKESNHSQSLRSKLVLSLALMLIVVVGIDEIVRQKVIAPEFANLERVTAQKDTNRVLSAINTEFQFLSELATLDANQIQGRAVSKLESSSQSTRVQDRIAIHGLGDRVEWAAVVTDGGQWNWLARDGRFIDSTGVSDSVSQVQATPDDGFRQLIARIRGMSKNAAKPFQGLTRSDSGLLSLFAAIPIGNNAWDYRNTAFSADESTVDYFVVGRHFGAELQADIEHRTSVSFSIEPVQESAVGQQTIEVNPDDSAQLLVTCPLYNVGRQTIAELHVRLPRDVTTRSNRATAFARYLSLCGACVSLLLLLLLLQRIVIGRLDTIRQHTENIAKSGMITDGSNKPVLEFAGHDEIGQLAHSFDRMCMRLADAQHRLSDASHAAGMSLVADTVIHNVGNVLTNVNSLIETASNRVGNLRIEPLEKLADRLRSEPVDEALQAATPDYLRRLSQTLEGDKDDLTNLLQTLEDNIQHIHQVIRDQRRHANQPVKWEKLDLRNVVNEAVKCSQARLTQDNVHVVFDCELDSQVWSDRSLVLQILINVISNAGNATRGIKSRQPTLTIDSVKTKSSVHIRFRDNGCGMDTATLSQVFDAHFTTRQTGSGLGLHFCAIAMKRIGGSIRAESDGPDCGATFIVELPLEKPQSKSSSGRSMVNAPTTLESLSGATR